MITLKSGKIESYGHAFREFMSVCFLSVRFAIPCVLGRWSYLLSSVVVVGHGVVRGHGSVIKS